MIIVTIAITLIVGAFTQAQNTCAPECGGFSADDCADYTASTSSASKCYSCATGYIGGTKTKNNVGALCRLDTDNECNPACAACNDTSADFCYLCSYGYFDPEGRRDKATPCIACHETCLSCNGPNADNCFFCQYGFFDSLDNPYQAGTCDKCDTKCSSCRGARNNCGNGCCAAGFEQRSATVADCLVSELC
jgi:hypothetical protein